MALLRVHLTIAVLLPSCVSSTFPPLNATTIARVDSAILTAFSLPANGTYGVYCNPCANGDAIGSLVRLPFHDAVGGGRPGGKGGPNGCIDFTFAGNNGLQEVVGILETAYTAGGFASLLSKADFWVLAGNTAVRIASMLPPGTLPEGGLPMPDPEPLLLPFHYGRVDDATCDGVDGAFLPAVQASYADTAAIFCSRVGMTPRQLVAIMGAHTVGRAQGSDSGYDGGWSGFSSSFSIMYYWQLLAVDWNAKDAPDGSWTAPPPSPGSPLDKELINLQSSDVELVISPSGNCSFFNELNFTAPTPSPAPGSACPVNAINVAALKEFTSNQTAWWLEFADAWRVMTEFSYNGLLPPVGATGA